VADPILKTYGTQAAQHFERAAEGLALRQTGSGAARGNVVPWAGCADLDFHGTLAAIWIWARHEALSGDRRFGPNREAGWTFVEAVWRSFIPEAIGPQANDEAAYDCAMVLRAALAERAVAKGDSPRAGLVGGAARVLAAYLAELHDLSGRDFQDPGFLAWNLIEYARAVEDRGLLAAGRRFVEQAFGMKAPPAFAAEPETAGGLFDFSSTTATRVLAIVASEGNTPFVGAWLRERVAAAIPPGFVRRGCDEGCWNGCVAALLGRAYVVSTESSFLNAYRAIRAELERRSSGIAVGGGGDVSGARRGGVTNGAEPPAGADTLATFYSALAADALVRGDGVGGEASTRGANARR
jgi:hypothetical protein